mgnify:FL=1
MFFGKYIERIVNMENKFVVLPNETMFANTPLGFVPFSSV